MRTGPIEVVRERPWALVSRAPTADDDVWCKINASGFAYEAGLLAVLDRVLPGAVPAPFAANEAGWFLTVDAGPTLDPEALTGDVGASIGDLYGSLQRASAEVIDELIGAGVPDRRPHHLLALFDRALGHPAAGDATQRCQPLRSAIVEACDALTADGRLAVVNGDFKPSHVFVGPPMRLFDWGDAVISHPLVSVITATRNFESPDVAIHIAAAWEADVSGDIVAAASVVTDLLLADVWLRDPPTVLERHPDQLERTLLRMAATIEGR